MNGLVSLAHRPSARGFTLVELLVVLAIIVLLASLTVPAISALQKSNDLNAATSSVQGILDEARTFAMANNTYVFVGVEETQFVLGNAAPASGSGRVAIQSFSSLDGTMNLAPGNLHGVTRLQILNGLDLPASLSTNTGTLAQRPSADYVVGDSGFPTASATFTSQGYTFSKIIAFDPQGRVHLPTSPPVAGLQYLEIDLQPANGSVPVASAKDVRAIQIDGLTGMVTVYRS